MVQGAVGFGFALVAAPVLMVLQPNLVPGPITLAGLLLSFSMAYRERKSIQFKSLLQLFVGFIPGLFLGATLLTTLSSRTLSLLFGLLVLLAVLLSLARLPLPEKSLLATLPAGILSGIMNITTSMGGPPVALLFQNEPGPRFRGTLALFFFLGSLMTLMGLNQIGKMGEAELWEGVALVPAVVVGLLLAQPAACWLDQGKTRQGVLTMATLSGIGVILKALWE